MVVDVVGKLEVMHNGIAFVAPQHRRLQIQPAWYFILFGLLSGRLCLADASLSPSRWMIQAAASAPAGGNTAVLRAKWWPGICDWLPRRSILLNNNR